MSKMKAAIDKRDKIARMGEAEKPKCNDDEMLIRALYTGISNGTARNMFVGESYASDAFPNFHNYQMVGRVEECGKCIKNYNIGDIIYSGTFTGYVEYFTVREEDLIAKLPPTINPKEAVYFGASGVGLHIIARADVQPFDKVLMFGAGVIGLFAAQAAQVFGTEVTIVDVNEKRLRVAKEVGVDHVVNLSTPAGRSELDALAPFDVVFDVTARIDGKELLEDIVGLGVDGASLLGQYGKLVLTTGRYSIRYDFNAAQEKEIRILHVNHFLQEDLDNLVRLVDEGRIKIGPLITRNEPIDNMPKIYSILVENPSELLGTVFDWTGIDATLLK